MTPDDGWPPSVEAEWALARRARAAGNEGRARVCARRAAGLAIRAAYRRGAGPGWGGDALAQLRRLQGDAAAPEGARQAAARLITTVDFDHNLPFDEDPLEDARLIINYLQGAWGGPARLPGPAPN